MASTAHRVIKNTGFLYVRTIVSLLLNFFTTRYLLQALGVSDYGLYNVIGGSLIMLGFLSGSMSSATQRFISYTEGSGDISMIKKVFSNAVILHYILALICFVVYVVIGLVFFNGLLSIPDGQYVDAVIVYMCMIVSTIFAITVVPYDAEINAHEKMSVYAVIGILDVVLKFLIAIFLFWFADDRLIFYSVLMALEAIFIRALTKQYCKRNYEECRQPLSFRSYDRAIIKSMLSFSGWNLWLLASGMLSFYGGNVILNHYFGTTVNAAMGIAMQLAGAMMAATSNMKKALLPALVKAEGERNHDQMLRLTMVGSRISFALFSFICVPVLGYLNSALGIWLDTVPMLATSFCFIYIVSKLLEEGTALLYNSICADGNIKYYCIVRGLFNILPLIVTTVMFYNGIDNPLWFIINWLIGYSIIGGVVNIYYSKKIISLSAADFVHSVILPVMLSSVIAAAISFVSSYYNHNVLHIQPLLAIMISYVMAIPVYWYISVNRNERTLIYGFVKKLHSKRHHDDNI